MKRIQTLSKNTLILGLLSTTIGIMPKNLAAKERNISAEDYAIGSRRFAAISKKTTPILKTAFQKKDLEWGAPIFIRAFKKQRTLEVWVKQKEKRKFTLFRTYPIAAASGTLGPKHREGDRQVPEGFYLVKPHQMNPQSRFHLAFNIGYPNAYDKAHGRTGSFIMVHGSNVSIGCLAMTDEKIEEIYTLAHAAHQGGQAFFPIHIFPFPLTAENLTSYNHHPQLPFWRNLQSGYQWFEEKKIPPNVHVNHNQGHPQYHFR